MDPDSVSGLRIWTPYPGKILLRRRMQSLTAHLNFFLILQDNNIQWHNVVGINEKRCIKTRHHTTTAHSNFLKMCNYLVYYEYDIYDVFIKVNRSHKINS